MCDEKLSFPAYIVVWIFTSEAFKLPAYVFFQLAFQIW